MDTVIRTHSGAPLITPPLLTPRSARGMSNDKFAALAATKTKKDLITSTAQKAFDAPPMKVAEKSKAFVREKIEGIKKRLQILRKLFGSNPKEMAKALTQIFKELKAAIKEYKAAVKDEIGASADVVAGMMPAEPPPAPADAATKPEDKTDGTNPSEEASDTTVEDVTAETATSAAQAEEPSAAPNPNTATEDKTALYGKVGEEVRKMAGEDGMAFAKEMKGLVQWIEDKMLAPARIQMKAQKPNKETDKAFEDVEKNLKDLCKDMEDMERDIKRDVPTVGQHIDIAA